MAGEASGDLNLSRGSNFGDDGRVTLKQDSETTKIPTMLPVKKRPLDIDNCNSSHSSAKKSKVSVCDDDDDDDDHMPISCIVKRSSISADKPLSVMKKQQEVRSNERPLDTDNCNSSHSSAKKSKVSLCDDDDDDDDDDMPISWRVKRSSISADEPLSVMKKQQEEEFVCPVKEESNLGSQENDIELRENRLKGQLEEFKSKEKEFEGRVEELEFKVNQLKGQIKEFESKEEQSVEQVKDLELRNKHSESLMEELKTREKKLEDRVEELELKEKKLEDRVKEFELKMKEFESQVKEHKSDKRREKQNEVSLKSIEEENELGKYSSLSSIFISSVSDIDISSHLICLIC
ncbi:uncharacterized protein LOC130745061 [Lotus japonicus]|uniref:uncharacterized protein LOC130745061 n=1 Tax=Lotus japonicus TaxID=34305 RepID=UPI00258EEC6D|nr:uncharacterized protein LOC130745061 [Lotus japonicus]